MRPRIEDAIAWYIRVHVTRGGKRSSRKPAAGRTAQKHRVEPAVGSTPQTRWQPDPDGCRWSRADLWPAVVVATAALVLYGRSLAAPMFWDDYVHLWVVERVSWSWFLDHGMLKVYFRPLGGLVWWASGRLFGPAALPLHLLNLVLLGSISLLLYRLGRRLGGKEWVCAAGALLAVANPITAATVVWAANVYSLLCVVLGLVAVDLALTPGDGWPGWAPALLLGLSALAKEEALVFVPAVMYAIWLGRTLTRRRVLHGIGVLGSVAAAFGWREAVLGGFGGVANASALLTPAVLVGGFLTVGVVAALWLSWSNVWWRLGLLLAAPAATLSALMARSIPRDPHGVYLRLFFTLAVGCSILLGAGLARVSTLSRSARGAAVAAVALVLAGGGWLAGGRVGRWLDVTRSSEALVERTCHTLEARGLGTSGPVWVEGAGDEICLDAAVKLRHPEWSRRLVVLRPVGINFVIAPAEMWLRVERLLVPWKVPGNPEQIGEWRLGAGFARRSRWLAARAGLAPEAVIQVGGNRP